MNDDRRKAVIKRIFDLALDVNPATERDAFLSNACAGDSDLKDEVLKLLAVDATREMKSPASQAPELSSETLLNGRYKIDRELGRGGFGVVFLARDQQLHGRPVVVKIPNPRLLEDAWARSKFRGEIEALARIHHPGVVSVIDQGETVEGHPFMVMEFFNAEPLTTRIAREGMALREVAEILRQAGAALAAAHAQNVCHRDLKPDNILVQETGGGFAVKLIDFGIASIAAQPEGTTTKVVGSMPYMAPEQLKGRPNAQTDIYALGVVAYQMVTGRIPFEAASLIELHELQKAAKFVPASLLRPEIAPEASDLIAKALAYAPHDRFPSARDFTQSLAESLLGLASGKWSNARRDPPKSGQLIAKMCDRRSQEDDFKTFFVTNTDSRSRFVVIPGEEGACHESLVERLLYQVETISARDHRNDQPMFRIKKIPWQYEGPADVRQQRLLFAIVEQLTAATRLDNDFSPEALMVLLPRLQARFLVLQHEIRAIRWDQQSGPLIESYFSFLNQVTANAGSAQVLVFLNVIFPGKQQKRSWMEEFSTWRLRSRVEPAIDRLSKHPGAAPVLVLNRLSPITKEDVMEWMNLHDIFDSEEKRIRASDWVFPSDAGALRMADVESKLRDLHRNHLAERGVA